MCVLGVGGGGGGGGVLLSIVAKSAGKGVCASVQAAGQLKTRSGPLLYLLCCRGEHHYVGPDGAAHALLNPCLCSGTTLPDDSEELSSLMHDRDDDGHCGYSSVDQPVKTRSAPPESAGHDLLSHCRLMAIEPRDSRADRYGRRLSVRQPGRNGSAEKAAWGLFQSMLFRCGLE